MRTIHKSLAKVHSYHGLLKNIAGPLRIAGLGESCTNVTSLLWAIASGVQRRESQTITDKCIG